jgi:hypothetical protein
MHDLAQRIPSEVIQMRRSRLVLVAGALAGLAALASVALAAPGSVGLRGTVQHGGPGKGYGSYFAVSCAFSHRNTDDPIVFPRQPGLSHDHTYFGNNDTNASSTANSLRGKTTSCRFSPDTAAYWVPSLVSAGQFVQPLRATVYYVRRTVGSVQALPAGLQMIAGDAKATTAQRQSVTVFSCGTRRSVSSTIPDCNALGRSLRLQVNFPNCWNGTSRDSADHKSHLTYSSGGVCPATHPVAVPALTIDVRYPAGVPATAVLASGGQFSGHADFVNAWDQATLERLVARYLNRGGRGRK